MNHLAVNALRCLDIGGEQHRGHELLVVYNSSSKFKGGLIQATAEEARQRGIVVTVRDVDSFLNAYEDDNVVLDIFDEASRFATSDPLQRNIINLVGHGGRYDGIRRRITKHLITDKQAYVLQFPFDQPETAGALLGIDPTEVEGTALTMKKDLDRATHHRITSGMGMVLAYEVNPTLRWVVSVGKIKKYSPCGDEGEPIGGWGNPPGEIFTSFAHEPADHTKINGFMRFDGFTLGEALREEDFVTEIRYGSVDLDQLKNRNGRLSVLDALVQEFRKDENARHPGELGLGLVHGLVLGHTTETVSLEKIRGKVHVGFGYDEHDRGTGGFVDSAAHNDCGATAIFEAKINGRWTTVIRDDGSSPYWG